jgi:integrase
VRPGRETVRGQRLRDVILVVWHAGLRISEALALAEADLDSRRGAVLLRRGRTSGR